MSEEMKALREQLLRNDKNGYDTLDEAQLAEMEAADEASAAEAPEADTGDEE